MGNYQVAAGRMVPHNMVTTQFEIDGFRVVRTLGVVRGITVRSRSIFGTIGAGLQTIVGGNITLLTNLCERTRAEAFDLMLQHAAEIGGNAVVGARYEVRAVRRKVAGSDTESRRSLQLRKPPTGASIPDLQHFSIRGDKPAPVNGKCPAAMTHPALDRHHIISA